MLKPIDVQLREARAEKNADKLDFALRAEYHWNHRGTSVDTTHIQFQEVKMLDPNFYV